MRGLMQNRQLLISNILSHAETYHHDVPVVSLLVEGGKVTSSYGRIARRARQVAQALQRDGIGLGDRVATLAWNTHRHVEAWYGISGMGAITHTVNPRLFDEQIAYIINHAEDRLLLLDLSFVALVERLAPQLASIERYVILTDAEHMPKTSLKNAIAYEDWIASEDGDYAWPMLDENTASGLCYTSGTTGNPKGVLYSHRATVLHSYAASMADTLAIAARDSVLPIVPMYHANAWGVPYSATAVGAKMVLAGPHFDAPTLHKLILDEGVTVTAAVPTIWLGLLNHLEATGGDVDCLERVTIGGSAAPRAMIEAFENRYGVAVFHAWGMTEMSPLGTIGSLNRKGLSLTREKQIDLKCKQGRVVFGVEMKIVDDDGKELPRDGKAFGHLLVRGPWITSGYFKGEGGPAVDAEDWFDTGDVATLDGDGYMQITDRAKDVIKSGGEWISSIELENAAVGHPAVAEAAVIGVPHPKWDERPLLILVKKNGAEVTKDAIIDFLRPQIAKWWLPDDVVFVDEIPHTATGKIQKLTLRSRFRDYKLPGA
ncbi:MAG: 3-(methylthio)propionyl-CoA ligase [Pseudomonadota bacterium]